jgi:hypothetical protein
MNDTKWDEVRVAMYALDDYSPRWRTRDIESGHVSQWDREWYYHFRNGGYEFIEWLEIAIDSPEQRELVRDCLRRIGVPGVEDVDGFRVLGYAAVGHSVDYIR